MTVHRAALLAFALISASSASAETWRAYRNERFGTAADVPVGWRMEPPPENDDGRVFASPDEQAEIIVSGSHVVLSRDEEFGVRGGALDGETIRYKRQGRDWIVVSGVKGERIFYRKSLLSCGDTVWNSVSLEYPAAEKKKYDALVAHVAGSLRGADKCR
ncbi:hypothetical protein [Methylocystis sp. ATCC 49242]|uniref:hypothetical protein n=1 Tax=Methylocystis sp. ATCC 49242 TaxID=622637 RepID=UPI0001F87355|nr:hypothetical protein [Methylocystis sp. ATCC 49242]